MIFPLHVKKHSGVVSSNTANSLHRCHLSRISKLDDSIGTATAIDTSQQK